MERRKLSTEHHAVRLTQVLLSKMLRLLCIIDNSLETFMCIYMSNEKPNISIENQHPSS